MFLFSALLLLSCSIFAVAHPVEDQASSSPSESANHAIDNSGHYAGWVNFNKADGSPDLSNTQYLQDTDGGCEYFDKSIYSATGFKNFACHFYTHDENAGRCKGVAVGSTVGTQISLKDKDATDYACMKFPFSTLESTSSEHDLDGDRFLVTSPPSNDVAVHGVDGAIEIAGSVIFDTQLPLTMADLKTLSCQYSTSQMGTYEIKEGFHCWFYSHPANIGRCADGAIRYAQGPEHGDLRGTSKWGVFEAACFRN